MNSKIVIFFHPHFSDGGVERTNIGLAKGLIANGYDVVFLTTSYTNHFLDELKANNIKLVSLGEKKISNAIFDLIRYLNSMTQDKEIVFISCQYYVNVISMIVSLFVKRREKIKFINSERNHIDEFKVNGGFKNRVIPYLVKFFYRYADFVIANAKETADDLSSFIKRDVQYIYNPTINSRIDKLKNEEFSEEWFLNDNRKAIIGIGRFTKQKDFETLIKAFALFNKTKDYKLVLLGDGQLRDDLQALVVDLKLQSDVYMPGFVKNPYKFLISSELFVLSSRYEGLPNVLIEALYLGVPSISTKCKSGPKEILGDENYLVNIGNYEQMADKMRQTIDNREEFLNVDFRLERFKYENIIKDFIEVIEK